MKIIIIATILLLSLNLSYSTTGVDVSDAVSQSDWNCLMCNKILFFSGQNNFFFTYRTRWLRCCIIWNCQSIPILCKNLFLPIIFLIKLNKILRVMLIQMLFQRSKTQLLLDYHQSMVIFSPVFHVVMVDLKLQLLLIIYKAIVQLLKHFGQILRCIIGVMKLPTKILLLI